MSIGEKRYSVQYIKMNHFRKRKKNHGCDSRKPSFHKIYRGHYLFGRGYIEIMENDLGELGETVEDYNRNWEFQSILLKLYEK